MNAAQSGPWNVGIDPVQNVVRVEAGASFFYDSGFEIINDSETLDLGPFDLSDVQKARIVVRGVNGDIHAQVFAETGTFDLPFDSFTADGEDGSVTKTFVYEAPPPLIYVRLTESGPGGSNYHVMLIGR